jgi:hypothetical protein
MAYTTIDDPSVYFQTQLYTGNGGTQTITNSGNSNLQPDWIWTKERTNTSGNQNHTWVDSSRGSSKQLFVNLTSADATSSAFVTSFNSDGFSLGYNANINNNSSNYVAWQWKVNGGSATSFSESGSQIGGARYVNTTAGISIITYTGNGSSDSTIPHGLGVTPEYVIVKNRDDSTEWVSNGSVLGNYTRLHPNANSAAATGQGSHDYIKYPDTNATNLVTGTSHNRSNADGDSYVAWCFASKQGYSKIGTYVGNGQADGPFIYTGFKPAWLMVKRTDASNDWFIIDNTRDDYQNPFADLLSPNLSDAENANTPRGDFLSNGFKWQVYPNAFNAGDGQYFYMAFAESPFVSSAGVPTTAK